MVKLMGAISRKPPLDEPALKGFAAPGMRAATQARSRELVLRLFNEGLALLREVDFDGLSIETLCARSDATVGAFYSRFENKEAFIGALQRIVVARTRERVIAEYEANAAPRESLGALAFWIARGVVAWHRRYEGLVRASLRRANGASEMWTPIRELGALQISYALPRMLGLVPAQAQEGAEDRARLAFQMLFGTLNNMLLINPGPYTIHHPATAEMLAAAMTQYVLAGPAPKASAPASGAAAARSSRR